MYLRAETKPNGSKVSHETLTQLTTVEKVKSSKSPGAEAYILHLPVC